MASRWLVAEIPLVTRGLFGTKNYNEVPIDGLIDADGLTFEDGNLRKEGGAVLYNSSAITGTPSILGGHDWNHNGSTQKMVIAADDGKLYKDDGTGTFAVTLKSGLTVSINTVPVFIEGGKEGAANNRKLFIYTGTNQVQVLSADGATTADIATPPADWATNYPLFGVNHEGRMWGGGNPNDPHRMYYSTLTDHEDFTSEGSGTMAVFPGEGETLVNAFSFKGYIVCFKYPRGIYIIDTRPVSFFDWKVWRYSGSVGAAWTGAMAVIENDIVFIDPNADIRTISSVDDFSNIGTFSLSDVNKMDDWFRDNLDFSKYKQWRCIYYNLKREVQFALTGIGTTDNNYRVVFDTWQPSIPRFRYSSRDTPVSMWLRNVSGKSTLMMGEDAGFIYTLDNATRSKNGNAYSGVFQTPHLDMSHLDSALSTRRKNLHFLEVVSEPTGNNSLNCDIYHDNKLRQTITFNLNNNTGGALGSFVLGTSTLGSSTLITRKKRLTGGGRRISIRGANNAAGEDISISRMYVHFHVGDERIVN
jgi:hypothetical protein